MVDTRILVGARTPQTIDLGRLLMKSALLARLRSFIVVLLLMLVSSVVIWGVVYLLNSTRPR
jgi:hypothetical protein